MASLSASAATTETFDSERYGYSITWDEAVWGSRASWTSDDYESVEIRSGASLLSLEAFPSEGNDADDCLDAVTRRLEQTDGVDNVTEDEDLPLPPGPEAGEDVLLTYDLALEGRASEVEMVQYLSCVAIDDGDAFLVVGAVTRLGIYEEELEIIKDVIETLEIPADEAR